MTETSAAGGSHDHRFGQHLARPGEAGTWRVAALTAAFMVAECAAGLAFASMALLADGLHMASHAGALLLQGLAYRYARRRAADRTFSFGTGKVNALAGFASAVALAGFALVMAAESVARLVHPVAIAVDQALVVAVLGLLVNVVSVFMLGHDHDHEHDHDHPHGAHDHDHPHGAHDLNLVAARLHVLADALTSVLAIAALLAAKHLGLVWMDPLMGVAGALLVARWSWRLLVECSAVLLDRQAPLEVLTAVRSALEADGRSRVVDLHVWSIGPGLLAAAVTLESHDSLDPGQFHALLPARLGLAHVTVEVRRPPGE